jgi:hypothetical protein
LPSTQRNQSTYFKATEANRRRGPGTREKVRSRRINLEGNTHAQEINASQLPVYLSLSQSAKTLVPSYYCLYSLFNKIRDKGNIVSAGYRGGGGVEGGGRVGGKGEGWGQVGEMTQVLYAYMNNKKIN